MPTVITESIAKRLKLNLMVGTNTDPQDTAFTVSVDLKGNGVTTGISANDRAKTIKAFTGKPRAVTALNQATNKNNVRQEATANSYKQPV